MKHVTSVEDEVLARYMGWDTTQLNVWINYNGMGAIPEFTQSLDQLFSVISHLKLESFNIYTEVYGVVNAWAGESTYNVFPLAREIVKIIEKWTDGISSRRTYRRIIYEKIE